MRMENETKAQKLWTLFSTTFSISATTNGGFAIVSMMRNVFVNKHHYLEEEEILDMISIAQSCPGPIAINTSILVGYKVDGVLGGIVTMAGTVLPPLIIMTIVYYCYNFVADNIYLRYFMRGMQAGVAALLVDVTISMFTKNIAKKKSVLNYILMITAFILIQFTDTSVFWIALGCATCGIIKVFAMKQEGGVTND